MRRLTLASAFIALTITAAPAQEAAPAIVFGEVGFGGTGCPDGTAIIIMSPDKQSASLVFTDYAVGDNGRAVDRKTCAIAVPIAVPAGTSVAIQAVAVRGEANLPADIDGTLSVEAFFAGTTGPVEETALTGDGNFAAFTRPAEADLQWSACGTDVNLRVNTSLRTRGDGEAKALVRAINLFRLVSKPC